MSKISHIIIFSFDDRSMSHGHYISCVKSDNVSYLINYLLLMFDICAVVVVI